MKKIRKNNKTEISKVTRKMKTWQLLDENQEKEFGFQELQNRVHVEFKPWRIDLDTPAGLPKVS